METQIRVNSISKEEIGGITFFTLELEGVEAIRMYDTRSIIRPENCKKFYGVKVITGDTPFPCLGSVAEVDESSDFASLKNTFAVIENGSDYVELWCKSIEDLFSLKSIVS